MKKIIATAIGVGLHYLAVCFVNFKMITMEDIATWDPVLRGVYLASLFVFLIISIAAISGTPKAKNNSKKGSTLPAGL